MLTFFNRCSQGRSAWFLLAISVTALELTALYFQHVMLLAPCVLCIYERCALFGILGASLVALLSPSNRLLRFLAILIWLYSAWEGLRLSWKHTMMQLHPSPFNTCDFFVSFPSWLPLDTWLPSVFKATGDCSVKLWSFLGLEMPQWLVGIFGFYLLIGVVVLLAQFFGKPKKRSFELFNR